MAKRQVLLLSFCQSTQRDKGSLRRTLMMIKTKNQMTLIAKMYRLKKSPEESEHESEQSCHDP